MKEDARVSEKRALEREGTTTAALTPTATAAPTETTGETDHHTEPEKCSLSAAARTQQKSSATMTIAQRRRRVDNFQHINQKKNHNAAGDSTDKTKTLDTAHYNDAETKAKTKTTTTADSNMAT